MNRSTIVAFVGALVIGIAFGLVVDQLFVLIDAPTVGKIVSYCVGIAFTLLGTIGFRVMTSANSIFDGATGGAFSHFSLGVVVCSAMLATIEFGVVFLVASLLRMEGFAFFYVVVVAWLFGFYVASLLLSRMSGIFGGR